MAVMQAEMCPIAVCSAWDRSRHGIDYLAVTLVLLDCGCGLEETAHMSRDDGNDGGSGIVTFVISWAYLRNHHK